MQLRDLIRRGIERETADVEDGTSPFFGHVLDTVCESVPKMDETFGGGMDEVNRAVGRFVKEAYRTAWRAEDQSERKRNH